MNPRIWLRPALALAAVIAAITFAVAQAPPPARLLVLLKGGPSQGPWVQGAAALTIVDPVSGKILGRVPTGENSHEVAASEDGRLAFVTAGVTTGTDNGMKRYIFVIDVPGQKEVRRVDIGARSNPHGVYVAGGKAYFTAEGYKSIGRYDPASNQIDWWLGIGKSRTHMLVVTKDLTKVFTADGAPSNNITIVEGAPPDRSNPKGWNMTVVPAGNGPEGITISPDGREVWAGHTGGSDSRVTVVDVAGNKVSRTVDIQAQQANRLQFTPDGRLVLVSDIRAGDLIVVDAASGTVARKVKIGTSATGIVVTPDGTRAFVAAEADDYVAIVDLKTFQVTGKISFPAKSGPDGMAWAGPR